MRFFPKRPTGFGAVSRLVLTLLLGGLAASGHAGPTVYVDDSAGKLAQLDVATGNSTILGTMPTTMTDIAFSPSGTLYAVDFGSNLWQINPITATGANIGSVGSVVNALVFGRDGTLYAAGGNALFTVNVDGSRNKSRHLRQLQLFRRPGLRPERESVVKCKQWFRE